MDGLGMVMELADLTDQNSFLVRIYEQEMSFSKPVVFRNLANILFSKDT